MPETWTPDQIGQFQAYWDTLLEGDLAQRRHAREDMWGPLFQADCHSRLRNEQGALAACERLADDHWTPGMYGTPAGSKTEVIAEVRRRLDAGKGGI